MTWNEFKRRAVQKGWVFIRHGSRHDVYKKEGYEGLLLIERHWQEEMKPLVIIEKDSNGFTAFTDNLSTVLHGSGTTVEEAKEELMAGYRDVLDYYNESGVAVPDELVNLTFEYKYDISAIFNAFDFLNASIFAERIGISPSLMRHYKSGDTYISSAQAKKIESGLHQIGRELLSVML